MPTRDFHQRQARGTQGLCVHQDHAGVGVAIPDELNVWRLAQLKKMGANAIRTSHSQPARNSSTNATGRG